jgi:hypothetical protein
MGAMVGATRAGARAVRLRGARGFVRGAAWPLVWSFLAAAGCSDAGAGGSSGELGDPCQSSADCPAGVCLLFRTNFEGVPGVCSSACGTSTDCASGGVCAPDFTGTFATACFRRCSAASDCSPGLACVWDANASGGVCAAIAVDVCSALLLTGDCGTCINNSCCNQYEDCVADLTCGKDYAGCGAGTSCTSRFALSPNSAESSLGSCMGSFCAGQCP